MIRLLLAIACLAVACSDDADPEHVPFEGLEVSGDPDKRTPPPLPQPPPEPSASATNTTPRPFSTSSGKTATGGDISGCCAALQAAASRARDEGTRAMNTQAASVCARKIRDVKDGKISRADALAQVRSTLLGSAPGSCR
ncbi:MAG TPA: hypothetical protein VFB62_05975 [Polyangiaceae bacterium]|jgi:hypothetical protein|nr:hypothetical protein [Polyangiaceae bacterium]